MLHGRLDFSVYLIVLQFNFSRTCIAQIHWSASFYRKALDKNHLRFCRSDGFCYNYSTWLCSAKVAVDNTKLNECNRVPIKLYTEM